MTKKAMAWSVSATGAPVAMKAASVDLEKTLEDWIETDVSIVVDDVLVIARQVLTDWGTRIDLLGMDAEGNLVILELKRKQTLRDTIAQSIEYAAWAAKLGSERIVDIAVKKFHNEEGFEEAFSNRFSSDLPDKLNTSQRIVVVAPEIDPVTTAVVSYLSETYRMPINAAWFDVLEGQDGSKVVVRLTVLDEDQVIPRPPGDKRLPPRSLEDMRNFATENGIDPAVFDSLLSVQDILPSVVCYQGNLNLRGRAADSGGYLAGISIYPRRSGYADCIDIAVSASNLARIFGRSAEDALEFVAQMRTFLKQHPSNWAGWERFGVSSLADSAKLVDHYHQFAAPRTGQVWLPPPRAGASDDE